MDRRRFFLAASAAVGAAAGLGSAAQAQQQNLACNCVLYARSRVRSLTFGLHTQADKARIINDYAPAVGRVAVHSYNHVSVVNRVEYIRERNGSMTVMVTIGEANYRACQIGTRRDTPARLEIVGYFRP